jgi:cyanophycin synthetase
MNSNASAQSSSLSTLELTGKPYAFQGYVHGFHQPTLRYKLHLELVNPPNLSEIDAFFLKELGVHSDFNHSGDGDDSILARLKHWPSALLNQANHPVFELARIMKPEVKNPNHYLIFQPCMDHGASLAAVVFVIRLLKLAFQKNAVEDLKEVKKSFSSFQKGLAFTGLQGFNQKYILKAASELGIQWFHLTGKVFQLGVGRNARWLDSSFTDATAVISSTLARHKPSAAYILHISGLPVAQHFLVRNKEEAIRRAEELGYPVVIKPADLDGGVGVKTNLQTAESVAKAFLAAVKFSQQVLVEKHVQGRDYRILVASGEVFGVYERVAGGVTGNGRDSVTTLLERQNQERELTKNDPCYSLHSIAFDEEAKELLLDQHLDGNSVPADGQWIRLRGACNIASGGVPIFVPLHQVHPDNLLLALRAAKALRLDVAGIDLLISDIEHSWLETGASICEVNAKPQMALFLQKPMLVTLFKGGNGRIPVMIIVEAEWSPENISFSIQRECIARGINAGLVSGKEVWTVKECVNKTCSGAFDGARKLSLDSTVDAIILHVTDNQVMRTGWPVEWCDVLLVGKGLPEHINPAYSPVEWLSFAETLCPQLIIMEDAEPEVYNHAVSLFNSRELLSEPCWAGNEERPATVMKVVNWVVG